jgi:hypothetical protein
VLGGEKRVNLIGIHHGLQSLVSKDGIWMIDTIHRHCGLWVRIIPRVTLPRSRGEKREERKREENVFHLACSNINTNLFSFVFERPN